MHSYILMCMHTRTYILRFARAREERGGVFVGYSWGIHGVFMGYSYVSGMCRVCIGYVSGMYRNIQGARGLRYKIPCRYLQVSKKSSTFVGNFEAGSGERESESGKQESGNGNRKARSEKRESGSGNQESKIKN